MALAGKHLGQTSLLRIGSAITSGIKVGTILRLMFSAMKYSDGLAKGSGSHSP